MALNYFPLGGYYPGEPIPGEGAQWPGLVSVNVFDTLTNTESLSNNGVVFSFSIFDILTNTESPGVNFAPYVIFNNYLFFKVGNGMSMSEKIR